jgi:hypothetical protein
MAHDLAEFPTLATTAPSGHFFAIRRAEWHAAPIMRRFLLLEGVR